MSRKQYTPPAKSHEGRITPKKEKELRKKQMEEAGMQEQFVPQETPEELIPTEEDKQQLRNLSLIAGGFILMLLAVMYWLFVS